MGLTFLLRLSLAQLRPTLRSTTQGARAAETLKFPIAPMGKLLTCLHRLTLDNCERFGQLQDVRATETLKSSHRPDGKMADMLASTHSCTTVNALVNYSMYVLQRPSKAPIMGDSHFAPCLQGGGFYVAGGTVAISSCTISGNRGSGVHIRAQNCPSLRWENC
jgi:hypothetical protein